MKIEDYKNNYLVVDQLNKSETFEMMMVYNKTTGKGEVIKFFKNKRVKKIKKKVRVLTNLKHQNIIRTERQESLRNDENEALGVIVTYANRTNGDLFDFLKERDFDVDKNMKYNIFRQMLLAVQYLHDQNLAHCDIRPENFLIEIDELYDVRVFLSSFDHLITQKKKKTKKYQKGNFLYRSPETMLNKRKINAKAVDVYALGISFHVILNGFLPYLSRSLEEAHENVRNGFVTYHNELSLLEADLLDKMLDKNPKTRVTINQILEHPIFN